MEVQIISSHFPCFYASTDLIFRTSLLSLMNLSSSLSEVFGNVITAWRCVKTMSKGGRISSVREVVACWLSRGRRQGGKRTASVCRVSQTSVGRNTVAVDSFQLPPPCHWPQSWEEMHITGSWEQVGAGSSADTTGLGSDVCVCKVTASRYPVHIGTSCSQRHRQTCTALLQVVIFWLFALRLNTHFWSKRAFEFSLLGT